MSQIARAALIAVTAFATFVVAWSAALNNSPGVERSGRGIALFALSYTLLVIVEVVQYHRFRVASEQLHFFRRCAGRWFVVATTRKGWYPLFESVFALPAPQPCEYVWWRDRYRSPLRPLQLAKPPVDLPFAVWVRTSDVRYVPLGRALRACRSKPLGANVQLALDAIRSVTVPPSN